MMTQCWEPIINQSILGTHDYSMMETHDYPILGIRGYPTNKNFKKTTNGNTHISDPQRSPELICITFGVRFER
jgi:hypothetical protein